jgi:carbonic anhydrase/SulP family sulfate permease
MASTWREFGRNAISGLVVALVALPLCLGIAMASGAPEFAGLISGIVGGVVVGALSGSPLSVSGPAAGLTAIVAAQISQLKSFNVFLLAVLVAGGIQIVLGLVRAGGIAAFVPDSVIKGLLAAIGAILILKQIPHLVGHDADPEGEMSFQQPDQHNTFSELATLFQGEWHSGAMLIGVASVLFLIAWDKTPRLKKSLVPGPLVVVLLGMALQVALSSLGGQWKVEGNHLVQVPAASGLMEFISFFQAPDWSAWNRGDVWWAGLSLALVASLETLLNLEAVDKLDPKRRRSPPNRELLAQGVGNSLSGLIGGLPMTSVIVRSSVNVHAGGLNQGSAVLHGVYLLICIFFLPGLLNQIPLSALAAILILTGWKLVSPRLFLQQWRLGFGQFLPFLITLFAIVFTDLMIGTLIGLLVSLIGIFYQSLLRPWRIECEDRKTGPVYCLRLGNPLTFLSRASLRGALERVPEGAVLEVDGRQTEYIDSEMLAMLQEFDSQTAILRSIRVSWMGMPASFQSRTKESANDSSKPSTIDSRMLNSPDNEEPQWLVITHTDAPNRMAWWLGVPSRKVCEVRISDSQPDLDVSRWIQHAIANWPIEGLVLVGFPESELFRSDQPNDSRKKAEAWIEEVRRHLHRLYGSPKGVLPDLLGLGLAGETPGKVEWLAGTWAETGKAG